MIHPSSIIDPKAELDEGVTVGPLCVIGPRVQIGAGTVLRSHVSIEGDTTLGRDNEVHPFCVLGMSPQESTSATLARGQRRVGRLEIGDRNVIRQHVSVAISTTAGCPTRIGHDALIMGHSHIGHDCDIGDRTVITHGVGVSGHVTIEEGAVLGGQAGVHQFMRIGKYAMVGGKAGVICDIPPFAKVAGLPPRYLGCNVIGLKRAQFKTDVITEIEEALEALFARPQSLHERHRALDDIERQTQRAEIYELITFIRESQRGVCAPRALPR